MTTTAHSVHRGDWKLQPIAVISC